MLVMPLSLPVKGKVLSCPCWEPPRKAISALTRYCYGINHTSKDKCGLVTIDHFHLRRIGTLRGPHITPDVVQEEMGSRTRRGTLFPLRANLHRCFHSAILRTDHQEHPLACGIPLEQDSILFAVEILPNLRVAAVSVHTRTQRQMRRRSACHWPALW